MADYFVRFILPFVPRAEILGVAARTSWQVYRASLDAHEKCMISWRDEAMDETQDQLAKASGKIGHGALEQLSKQLQEARIVNDIAKAYIDFSDARLDHWPDDSVVNQCKVLKSSLQDTITRWVCLNVGMSNKNGFDAQIRTIFGRRFDEGLRSKLHNSYRQNVSKACVRYGFKSKTQIVTERRGRARPQRVRKPKTSQVGGMVETANLTICVGGTDSLARDVEDSVSTTASTEDSHSMTASDDGRSLTRNLIVRKTFFDGYGEEDEGTRMLRRTASWPQFAVQPGELLPIVVDLQELRL